MNAMKSTRESQVRKCVGTNQRYQKSDMLRVVRKGDAVVIDELQQIQGRGAYIKPDAEVIRKAQKKNAFARALRMKVEKEIYDALLELLSVVQLKENMDE